MRLLKKVAGSIPLSDAAPIPDNPLPDGFAESLVEMIIDRSCPADCAAVLCGARKRDFRQWMAFGEEHPETPFGELFDMVEFANASVLSGITKNLAAAGSSPKAWLAAMALGERLFPETLSQKYKDDAAEKAKNIVIRLVWPEDRNALPPPSDAEVDEAG